LPSNDKGIFNEPLPSKDKGTFTKPLASNDRGDTQTHTQTEQRDLISLLLFFQNKESRLKGKERKEMKKEDWEEKKNKTSFLKWAG
jgi:hypothetical protein